MADEPDISSSSLLLHDKEKKGARKTHIATRRTTDKR
jgi:hypothetical protein